MPSELLAATGAGSELQRIHAFLQHSVSLGDGFACNDITGDSRAVVLGMSDGSLHIYSWAAQARKCGQHTANWIGHAGSLLLFSAKHRGCNRAWDSSQRTSHILDPCFSPFVNAESMLVTWNNRAADEG